MICNVTQRRQFIKIKNLFHPTQDRDLQTSSSSITNVSHGCSLRSLHLLIKSDSKPDTVVISSFTFFAPHVSLLKSPCTHIPDTPTVSVTAAQKFRAESYFVAGRLHVSFRFLRAASTTTTRQTNERRQGRWL